METSTNIRKMFAGNQIIVPNYQRAYTWDIAKNEQPPKQVDVFLSDLEEHLKSGTSANYYFGHFLFENKVVDNKEIHYVVDGQQRMTTIVIFTAALLNVLKKIRDLSNDELDIYEDIIKRRDAYRFETVYYDRQKFIDIVINNVGAGRESLDTESSKRIYDTYSFFLKNLSGKSDVELKNLLDLVMNASCTTHSVKNESEAIQMFIFQNNRGKKPSDLEVIKAQFMFYLHLYAREDKELLIDQVKNRFETIYRSISKIENNIDEDDVLRYVLRIYFNNLWEYDSLARITKKLEESSKDLSSEDNCVSFICQFTDMLANSFGYLTEFYKEEISSLAIHSLITIGGKIGIAMPFVLKAYLYQISFENKEKLFMALADLLLRDRLVRTRAEMESRLKDVYTGFSEGNSDITPILEKITYLKNVATSEDRWASYWNNEELERGVISVPDNSKLNSKLVCLLLWKYETYLQGNGKKGYKDFLRFDEIIQPEVEHIAPKTEPNEQKATGYDDYTDEFIKEGLDSWGNYLLISKSHNCSIGNVPFADKLKSYNKLNQQREIKEFLGEKVIWNLEAIKRREKELLNFFLNHL